MKLIDHLLENITEKGNYFVYDEKDTEIVVGTYCDLTATLSSFLLEREVIKIDSLNHKIIIDITLS